MALNNFTFAEICQMIIVPAFFDTLKMLVISGVLSTFLGFFVGVILIITEKGGLCENVVVNRILDFIVNTVRSFPFIILMVSIIPFTRLIVGTSIGDTAALVPLTVAVTPFMGRIFQNSFIKRIKNQLVVILVTNNIADNSPVTQIEDRAQIELVDNRAFIPLKLCHIGQPLFIWPSCPELPVQKILCCYLWVGSVLVQPCFLNFTVDWI